MKCQKLILPLLVFFLIYVIAVIADGFGDCPFGDYPFGDSCAVTPPPQPVQQPSGGGGGGGSITIPPELTNPFGTTPSNGTCGSKQQILDNRCYDCDPKIGYLLFNPNDRSVLCITCSADSILINKTCISTKHPVYINQTLNISPFLSKLDAIGTRVNPKNSGLGVLLLLSTSIVTIIWLNRPKKEKPVEKEEEDII